MDYKAVFNQSSSFLILINNDFTLTNTTETYLTFINKTRTDVVGINVIRDFSDIFPFLSLTAKGKVEKTMNWVINNNRNETSEVLIQKTNNKSSGGQFISDRFWRIYYSPIWDHESKSICILARVEDVSEIVLSISKLKDENIELNENKVRYENLEKMFHDSPLAFTLLEGKEMRVTIANKSSRLMWAENPFVKGQPLLELLPLLKNSSIIEWIKGVYETGIPFKKDEVYIPLFREGVLRKSFFNIVYQPFYDSRNTILGISVFAQDVTDNVVSRREIQQSEERFRKLVLQAPVAICVLRGSDYVIDTINNQMAEMWGREASLVINKPAFDVLPEFRDQGLKELLDHVYKTGERFVALELPLTIYRNGIADDIFVKFIYEPLVEGNGTISGVMALAHEITEQVTARKKVEANEKFVMEILNNIPQIAWTNTITGEVVFFNQRWYDYTGLSLEETNTNAFNSVIHADDLSFAFSKYRKICKTGNEGEFQLRAKQSNGLYRWHLIRLTPSSIKKGNKLLWIGTATDIHELKILQEKKDDFIGIASHELKTPITSLKSCLQLLDDINACKSDPSSSKLITVANKSIDRVSNLINNLLDTSLLTRGDVNLHRKVLSLEKEIREYSIYARYKAVIKITTIGDTETKVYADPVRIEQVLVNLINNAIKYAPDSGEIIVKIEKISEMAKVSVIDKGVGIDPMEITHIFDRYFRTKRNVAINAGIGLGLYISTEIIRNHGGQMGVDSKYGQGSTFWFTLPLFHEI